MSILTSIPKQFSLSPDGQILWQPDLTNPLPGDPIARLQKGEFALAPAIDVIADADRDAVTEHLRTWLMNHIATTLEPLVRLMMEEEGTPENVKTICARLFHNLGVMPRTELEDQISTLDAEARKKLRAHKIKLGPILVFLPDLNKPAAVKMRALLWALYHGRALPPPLPKDGMVSALIDPATVDVEYQRAIGYPVYGPRMIRIDMLDRVVSAVYDNAKDGQFQAQHQMAEWMGCPIPDLYAVLEAMGHVKIIDPAAASAKLAEKTEASELPAALENVPPKTAAESTAEDSGDAAQAPPPEVAVLDTLAAVSPEGAAPAKTTPVAKPELATFRLRRNRPHGHQRAHHGEPRDEKADRPAREDRPKFDKSKYEKKYDPNKPRIQKDHKKDGKDRDRPHGRKPDRDRGRDDRPDRVITANAPVRADSSPFSILQNLKLK